MPKSPLARMIIYGLIATAILLPISLSIDWFPQAGSKSAHDIDTLYDVLLIVSVPIFVLVMTVAIYSVIRFHARPGDTGDGPPIHGNARLEVVWVVIPFILVSSLAAYAWITLHNIEKPKKGEMTRIADIQLQLRKTDPKKAKYDVLIQVDDSKLEKKDRTANEPVQFLVGRDKLRYEIVVNFVDKDRIRGYLSTPKDKALAAERPQFRPQ